MELDMRLGLAWLFVVGGAVAFLACLVTYRQELREKVKPESPVAIMGTMCVIAVVLLVERVYTQPIYDGCTLIDPNESWATYLLWLAAGCFWL